MGEKLDLPTKKEIKSLIKRGFISKTGFNQSAFACYNQNDLLKSIPIKDKNGKISYCSIQYDSFGDDVVSFYRESKPLPSNIKKGFLPIIRQGFNGYDFKLADREVNCEYTYLYGRYPCSALDDKDVYKIEKEYKEGNLVFTGREFCFQSSVDENKKNIYHEFLYNGKFFVRKMFTSNIIWFKEDELEWLVDLKQSILVCNNTIAPCEYTDLETLTSDLNYNYENRLELIPTQKELDNNERFSLPSEYYITYSTAFKSLTKHSDYAVACGSVRKFDDALTSDDKHKYKGNYGYGIHPTIDYDLIKDKCRKDKTFDNYETVYYGEYPQTFVDYKTEEILEDKFINGELNKTGKVYTRYHGNFKILKYEEYEYNGEKYIRMNKHTIVDVKDENMRSKKLLAMMKKEALWIKVEPIRWIVDETNIAISEEALTSGIYSWVDMNNFLIKYFSKDIIPSKIKKEIVDKPKSSEVSSDNVIIQIIMKKYNLSPDNIEERKRLAKIAQIINSKALLKELIEKNNLKLEDVKLDEEDNPIIRGLRF